MTALVMPVAGMGSRFSAAGYGKPKPMLSLDGRTFVEWAYMSGMRATGANRVVFVARQAHLDMGLESVLRAIAPDGKIVLSEGKPEGAAADAGRALSLLSPDEPVAVNDCDHAFLLNQPLWSSLPHEGDGIAVIGFPSTNPAHGFGLLSGRSRGELSAIVEKRVVGPLAVGGCYLFSSCRLLAHSIEAARSDGLQTELYMSRAVNAAIGEGIRAFVHPALAYLPFGTPEEMQCLRHGQVADMLGESTA